MRPQVRLAPYTTLWAGGPAEWFGIVRSAEDLAAAAVRSQQTGQTLTVLGSGSNVLPSDRGVAGVVLVNRAGSVVLEPDGLVVADTGTHAQDLFLWAAQAGLGGLEFLVGVPGTLGGALASNAGAYRSSIGPLVRGLEKVEGGERKWVGPEWMGFSSRDSRLRRPGQPPAVVVRARLQLHRRDPKAIYDDARDFQRQRISKQPPMASAGSFFKNVEDAGLAGSLVGLPSGLREAGVVPAGYLIEAVGLKGYRLKGAMFGSRHANFVLNVGNATARELDELAKVAEAKVFERFGVRLEREVLLIGDWG